MTEEDAVVRKSWGEFATQMGWGLTYFVMILWSLVSILSVAWVLMSSFKSNQELFASVWGLPTNIRWTNYAKAWTRSRMSRYMWNSVFVTLFTVGIAGLLGSAASYILARFQFWGNRVLLSTFVAGRAVPLQLILVPLYLMFSRLSITNSLPALIAAYVGVCLPFTVFVLTGFFRCLPRELEESAILDGASEYQVFWHVMLPLAKPGLITVSIFNFLLIWNEYVLALFLLSDPSKMTVPVGLYNLRATQGYAGDWGSMFAGLVIILVPATIVFLVLERRIVGGLTTGALKG